MKLLNVLANDGIDKEVFEILKNQQINIDTTHYEKEELLHKINDFDILVVRSATKVDKELIDEKQNLLFVPVSVWIILIPLMPQKRTLP